MSFADFVLYAAIYTVFILLPCWMAGSSAYVRQADDRGIEHPNPAA